MRKTIYKICFLCGEALDGNLDDDHIVQRQFVKGQPKQKGLDYSGTIKVHESCNKIFGNKSSNTEAICPKALQLLKLFFHQKFLLRQKNVEPELRIMAITESDLKGFSKSDLEYFGLIDGRTLPYSEITSSAFFKDKQQIDPFKKPINVALTVLAKSAAALLFKRHFFYPLANWDIFATSFLGDIAIDYDPILGETKPFYPGVKAWIKKYENGDWFCAYKLDELQVYFVFTKTEILSNVDELKIILPENDVLFFSSNKLIDMVGYDWSSNTY
jgi:hypothetical protein